MKKLYIFKPSENWSCCGGGLVILADNFKEAQSLFKEGKLFITQEEAEKSKYNWEIWTLVEVLECQKENKSRIILYDENWA